MKGTHTYTQKHPGVARRIITACGVSGAVSNDELQRGFPHPPKEVRRALWDTGSTLSAISSRLANKLGLERIGRAKNHSAFGPMESNVYSVNLFLPDGKTELAQVSVVCIDIDESVDILLGMDVITMCDFAITNVDEKTTFSFQIPSVSTVDFEKHIIEK